ncbi:MAG TPA: ABA4-like family protein [Allosphingosinicella sp.]|nr:ABA4-like family protein [Allosphingosinicella sp.]
MTFEQFFWIAHAAALVGWVALLVRPGPAAVLVARWAAAVLAVGYTILFLFFTADASVLASDYSLEGVGSFFAAPSTMLLGWVHYLAFDLFVGSWEAEEAHRLQMPRVLLVLCLPLTFLLGPLGLLVFLAARAARNSIAS